MISGSLPQADAAQGPSASASDIVVLGKIVGPHGLQGAVRVHPFADDPQIWSKLPIWWVGREEDDPASWQQARLVHCRLQADHLVAELDCFADRNAAEAAHGLFVGVPRTALPATAVNEYYWADLIGLDVCNTHGQALGQVLGLIETPANDVLRVGDVAGKERLLPFVAAVVLEVDLATRCVRVDWEADW